MSAPSSSLGDPAVLRRTLARNALDDGDATTALRWIDELPTAEQAPWLAEVWMLAGAPRAVARVLGDLRAVASADLVARAEAFVSDPPRRSIATSDTADPYADLLTRAEQLATLGRAAELALTHLGLAEVCPRVDWRAVHIDHASSLAQGLGDARVSALVRAYEAERELSFGEYEDALEAAHDAIEQGTLADEPRAVERATRVTARLAGLPPTPPQALDDGDLDEPATSDRTSEPEDL